MYLYKDILYRFDLTFMNNMTAGAGKGEDQNWFHFAISTFSRPYYGKNSRILTRYLIITCNHVFLMKYTIFKNINVTWEHFIPKSNIQINHTFIFKLLHSYLIDILFLWNGTVVQLQALTKKLNNRHDTIKCDFKYAKASIDFLDATGFESKEQNKLLSTAYESPKDRGCFLRYTSAHPKSLINSIPYSQSFRLKKKLYPKFRAF